MYVYIYICMYVYIYEYLNAPFLLTGLDAHHDDGVGSVGHPHLRVNPSPGLTLPPDVGRERGERRGEADRPTRKQYIYIIISVYI